MEIDFDSDIVTYEEILHEFWANHDAAKDRHYKGRQYLSILLFHDQEQKGTAEKVKEEWEQKLKGEILTELQAYSTFHLAEEYHQKYYLKRFKKAVEAVQSIFSNHDAFVHSTIAARLNGFVKGFGKMDQLKEDVKTWGLPINDEQVLLNILNNIRW
ncbi:peptide-methionine (S)-S-oxide reductase [Salirhabdus euzebyi]|uniref:peptide-methionine (S)-S-oxide reductase n=1 Tax=Salirhabdus euzebyi TaxID=394506 RepID=A0A841Q484_9BACI|nr:peptide-methionine (S)-S-oxide reductase [Salirhabdus euzebyi]